MSFPLRSARPLRYARWDVLVAGAIALALTGCQARPASFAPAPAATPTAAIAPATDAGSAPRWAARRVVGPTADAQHYLPEMLGQAAGIVTRWNRVGGEPVRVWLAPAPEDVKGWRKGFPAAVWDAFEAWNAAGLPVWFVPAPDSASAEVRVQWTERLAETDATARATWWISQSREIIAGRLLIGTTSTDRQSLTTEAIRGVALHEIGHLLGLVHTSCHRCIMFDFVQVNDLDPRDVETARRWYALPPGAVAGDVGALR